MLGLFIDRNNEKYLSPNSCGLQKLSKNSMRFSFSYERKNADQPYYYWALKGIKNNAFIEFNVELGINDIDIICGLEHTIEYDSKFSRPAEVAENSCALYLFPNRDSNKSECSGHYISSEVDIDFLLYEDAFQIRWGKVAAQRYYCLNNFLLMGLTQNNELISVTILKDIRQYIHMDYSRFGDCLDMGIYP